MSEDDSRVQLFRSIYAYKQHAIRQGEDAERLLVQALEDRPHDTQPAVQRLLASTRMMLFQFRADITELAYLIEQE